VNLVKPAFIGAATGTVPVPEASTRDAGSKSAPRAKDPGTAKANKIVAIVLLELIRLEIIFVTSPHPHQLKTASTSAHMPVCAKGVTAAATGM
jgi:hypothetical protein